MSLSGERLAGRRRGKNQRSRYCQSVMKRCPGIAGKRPDGMELGYSEVGDMADFEEKAGLGHSRAKSVVQHDADEDDEPNMAIMQEG